MDLNTHAYSNDTTSIETNSGVTIGSEFKLGILKICLFSTFFVLGLIGNSLVLIGIGLNKGMQTPTNLLIFNLALADILFIIVCIPTTLFSFFGRWPFAEVGCKLAQCINHLSAFMSIYLLVFMSIDRYLAVVHAIDSIANYRTTKNTTISIIALWLIGICISMIIGSLFTVIKFGGDQSHVSMYCLLRYLKLDIDNTSIIENTTVFETMNNSKTNLLFNNNTDDMTSNGATQILPIEASLYWLGFVIFLYALPLTIIVILYGLMLKFLRGARGQSVGKSKRRATRMILAVILTYALCWFFMQLLFISNVILSRNTSHTFATYMDILTMFANVFAYLNSCTNPILYGFMSKNFRSSFIDVLCCRYSKRRLCGPNHSSRNRRVTENYIKNLNSKYRKTDYQIRSSVASHLSQLNPITGMSNAGGGTAFSSSSRLTTELLPPYDRRGSANDESKLSIDNPSSCHITVGTQTNTLNKPHRRRKHGDKSPVVAYCSLPSQSTTKTTEVLCT
ncbi:unnamed protein product [Rotaria sp. Silwood2]|nr:unnamed protein product [Rotaria sp. Silwood2]CAF2607359.1 unnamed protein product [Rotaria sp. Silwood2]CAF2848876.1 unnamed protein product [Rotaria sp. Silwood2]CAF3021361.1 unnamed protein product [Rotaria sp. Silwood2]CAF3946423.1 unnamed protein product [Rotaria sp. Silwood2]